MDNYFGADARENPIKSLMMMSNGVVPTCGIVEWDYFYVKTVDLGDDFVSGSEGQIKTIKGYNADGDFIGRYEFKYADSDLPTSITNSKFYETEV